MGGVQLDTSEIVKNGRFNIAYPLSVTVEPFNSFFKGGAVN